MDRLTRRGMMLLMLAMMLAPTHSGSDVGQFCENEVFRAKCAADEVVILQRASYGRMKLSRCIDRDYGYVGCSSEVLLQADRKCSGLRSCQINVPNPEFASENTCPRDLKPYFEAEYTCLKVERPVDAECRTGASVVTSTHGYIASVATTETRVGTADCPWLIAAKPGQRINVTLHDYGRADRSSEICHAYAIVREKDLSQSRTICNSRQRQTFVYTTLSHSLEVRVLGTQKGRQFLLEYQVLGCPDIPSSAALWFRRETDRAKVGCRASGVTWTLRCQGNEWAGKWDNCSQVAVGAMEQEPWGVVSLPFGLSVALIVTIAIIIGVIFMVVGLFCLRWRRKRPLRGDDSLNKDTPYYAGFMGGGGMATGGGGSVKTSSSDPRRYVKRELPWPPTPEGDNPYATENEYSYIAEIQLPQGMVGQPPTDYTGDPPKYFVLDPFSPEGRNGVPPGERYVAPENQMGLPKRKDMVDIFAPSNCMVMPVPMAEPGYSYKDKTDYSHLSV